MPTNTIFYTHDNHSDKTGFDQGQEVQDEDFWSTVMKVSETGLNVMIINHRDATKKKKLNGDRTIAVDDKRFQQR